MGAIQQSRHRGKDFEKNLDPAQTPPLPFTTFDATGHRFNRFTFSSLLEFFQVQPPDNF